MEDIPIREGDAILWRIVAQFTRENNARDLKIQEVASRVDHIAENRQLIARLEGQVKDLEQRDQEFLQHINLMNRGRVTAAQTNLLTRLEEVVALRGSLDLLTEEETDTIRATLRTMAEQRLEYRDFMVRFSNMERWRDSHEREANDRNRIAHDTQQQVEDLKAFRDSHRETHRDLQQQLYEMRSGIFAQDEIVAARDMLTEWKRFYENHVEVLKEVVVWWTSSRGKKQRTSDLMMQAAVQVMIIAPATTVIVLVLHKFFGVG